MRARESAVSPFLLLAGLAVLSVAGAATPACAAILGAEELPRGAGGGDVDAVGGGDAGPAQDASGMGGGGLCDCPATQAWTKTFSVTGDVTIVGAATDSEGNVILAGSISGDLDVAGAVLPGHGTGDLDVLVMKLDPCGDVVWAHRFGDMAEQSALAVTIDPTPGDDADTVLVTGAYAGTLDFAGASGVLTTTNPRAFIARLRRQTGYGKRSADAGGDATKGHRGTGVAVSADGSIYWAGVESDDTLLFTRRLDPTLNLLNLALPVCAGCVPRVAPGLGSGALLAGGFTGRLDFADGNAGAVTASSTDIFVLSIEPDQSPSTQLVDPFGKIFGEEADQSAFAVASDDAGNVFIAGGFDGVLDMGPTTTETAGGLDAFAASLGDSLSVRWLSAFGDASEQRANAIALGGGALAIAGDFAGRIETAAGAGMPASLQSGGATDAFLVVLDPATGVPTFAQAFGGMGTDSGSGVAIDANQNAFVVGTIEGPVDFGCATLGGDGKAIFVAKRPIPR